MKLDFFNELKNNLSNKNEIKDFMKELSETVNEIARRVKDKTQNNLREEECLYYVVDVTKDAVYLQNLNIDVAFKETALPQQIKEEINTDTILRYKDGEYFIEEKLTQEFLENMVSTKDYQKIQQEFINKSKIEDNNPETRYKVLSQNDENDTTTLYYEKKGIKEIEVPNKLLPYNVKNWKIFYYEDGKFKTDTEATKENHEKWKKGI